jgi:hypothetical protein
MANKISEMTNAGSLTGTELIEISIPSGSPTTYATKSTTIQDIQDLTGYINIPQNSQSGNYTTVASDAGKHLYHPSGAGAGDTFTIDSNANVAYPIGTALTFVNMDSNNLSIAITSDTLYLAGAGTTGTRTLAQYGIATALKLTSTTWLISGTGLA